MPKALILDSNLLVLFIIGLADRSLVEKHKRTSAYTRDDFDLLSKKIKDAAELILTPNTLTEASNLVLKGDGPHGAKIAKALRDITKWARAREKIVPSAQAVETVEFPRLGLADSVQLELNGDASYLLTADLGLYLAAQKRGQEAVNFNHIRSL